MEQSPKNVKGNLDSIFADRNIPRVAVENDTGNGNIVEVINHEGEILTRVESADSIIYKINGKDLSTI